MEQQSFLLLSSIFLPMKKFLLVAGALAAATAPFLAIAPVQAAACPGSSVQLSTLDPLAFSCTQGNFTFTLNSFTGFIPTDSISFSNPSASEFTYSLNSDTPWMSGSKVLNYSVAPVSPKLLKMYTSGMSSAGPNPKAGTFTIVGAAGAAVSTVNNGSATSAELSYAVPNVLTTDTFTATLDGISGNGIQSVQGYVMSSDPVPPSSGVPGPLPILGAGAAFGFSRKLRNRIKAAA
jgi:hypothetical protein